MIPRLLQLLAELRKRWLLTLVVVGAIILIISAVLRVLTPPDSRVVTIPQNTEFQVNYNNTQSSFTDVIFTGQAPEVPAEFKVGKLEETQLSINDVENAIITALALRPVPNLQNAWVSDEYSLDKTTDSTYTLVRNDFETTKTLGIDQQKAVETAQTFLNKFFPNLPLTPITANIQFLSPHIESTSVTSEAASKVQIPFAPLIDSYPVIYATKNDYPFLLVVNNNYEIQKAFFYPQFISTSIVGKQKSLSVETALQNIRRGNASIIFANHQEWNGINLSTITKAEFTKATIEYRIDVKSGLIYPFFHFTGNLQNSDGAPFSAEVITPAVPLSGS